jgi:hypothetical protein
VRANFFSFQSYNQFSLGHGLTMFLNRGFSQKALHKLRNVEGGRP